VVIVPAGTVHGFAFRADSQGYVLTMDLDRLLNATGAAERAPIIALFAAPRTVALGSDRALAARSAQLFETLLREFHLPESLLAPVSGWLACTVLWILASACLPAAPMGPLDGHDLERLRRFRLLVEANYLRHWPVKRYAEQLALSESSLNRVCLSLAGGTAFEVIQQRLALEARRRLTYVADTVSTIGADLGFKDPAYFCRFFRKHSGMSPAAFRRRQK
jgi:AraC family transcriptional activator of pobA